MPFETNYAEGNEFSGDEGTEAQYDSGEEGRPLSDNEPTNGEDQVDQEVLKERLAETSKALKRRTERQIKALQPVPQKAPLKTAQFGVHFEGKLKEMSGNGLVTARVMKLAGQFPKGHIGQLQKVECRVKQNTMPCTTMLTVKGAKAPEPEVGIVDSDVKGHMIISARESRGKWETLFEVPTSGASFASPQQPTPTTTGAQGKKSDRESFEKKYAGVNSSNLRTKGVKGSVGSDLVELTSESPVLQFFFETKGLTVEQAVKDRYQEENICDYVPQTKVFVMHQQVFNDCAQFFESRLSVAKLAAFDDLEVHLERARLSSPNEQDPWTDSLELKHYAPNPESMKKLLEQEQKLEVMFRVTYM